jgi:hypothetical protein
MRIYCQQLEQSNKTRQIKMATVKGTTQNKRKRYEPTRNMSRELFHALRELLRRRQTYSTIEEVNLLIANYTTKDLQEALLVTRDINRKIAAHPFCLHLHGTVGGHSVVAGQRQWRENDPQERHLRKTAHSSSLLYSCNCRGGDLLVA